MITHESFLHQAGFPGAVATGISFFTLEDGRPVGTLDLFFSRPGGGLVGKVFVASSHQRQGIGRELLRQAAEYSQQLDKATLVAHVPEMNLEARRFFKALGFRPSEARNGQYQYVAFLPLSA